MYIHLQIVVCCRSSVHSEDTGVILRLQLDGTVIHLAYVMFQEASFFLKVEHKSSYYGKIPQNPEYLNTLID
jgi:hypothetical protein